MLFVHAVSVRGVSMVNQGALHSKQRLCGEDLTTIGAPLMAAVRRSLDPASEWHERRDALYEFIRELPPATTFDDEARRLLVRLGVVAALAPNSCSPEQSTSSETAHTASSEGEADAEQPAVSVDRFVSVEKLSSRHKKAFRCKHCQFLWVERVAALTKRNQRVRTCLCVSPTLPHKYFFTRNAKIDLKNIQALLKHNGVKHWRVQTTPDEFSNSRITVRLKHKRTKDVQNVVLRQLLAGVTKLEG